MTHIAYDVGDFVMTYIAYGLYLCISIAMTIWVARALSKNGAVFLVRCFGQDAELAASTNRLLVIGFYLVNLGFINYRLGNWQVDTVDLIPEVGSRVGISLLVLGFMHFFNMILIARFGRAVKVWAGAHEAGKVSNTEPPVPRAQRAGIDPPLQSF